MDNKIWLKQRFTWGQAWVDMIMLTNHEDGTIWPRGIETPVKRGQLGWSQAKLAARWHWSRCAVAHFMQSLESSHQISQQNNNASSIITILNYEYYQEISQQNSQQIGSRAAAEKQQSGTNKNGKNTKNEKNDKKTTIPHTPFQEVNLKIPPELLSEAFSQKWQKWLECRMAMKKPSLGWESLFQEQLDWLANFPGQAVEILSKSIRNGYLGLFPPESGKSGNLFQSESFAQAKIRRTHEAGEQATREAIERSKEKS